MTASREDKELEPLRSLRGDDVNHRHVEEVLTGSGWVRCGEGDWAIALKSPSGEYAARVSPFDPAYEYQVALYRSGAGNPWLPRLDLNVELEGGGCLLVMEFLRPVDEDTANALRRRVERADTRDREFMWALGEIRRVHDVARDKLRWCGPLDLNPGNFMRDRNGQVKIIDPFFMEGKELYGRVLTAPKEVMDLFSPWRRRYMFEIPYLLREASAGEVQNLRESLAAAERGGR